MGFNAPSKIQETALPALLADPLVLLLDLYSLDLNAAGYLFFISSLPHRLCAKILQEGQHPLTGQRTTNFRLLANQ